MIRYRGKITPLSNMKLEDYLKKIHAHKWSSEQLKSSLIMAICVNFGINEYAEACGINLSIDLDDIIQCFIDSENIF